uniref:hypothetical protein n=1 Tax=Streptococcus iniae TaxID=1346 RepID=UPI0016054971|nr:hypothetical protein [Streptococcus iniae]
MAILASSSYTITNLIDGADGKTPYWHTAYANSADGKTDFSLTVSDGKRYIGQYTDYVSADSSDPTKYKWVDMVGSIVLSTGNLLASKYLINNYSSKSFTLKAWANAFVEAINIPDIFKEGETYTISFDAEIIEKSTILTIYAKQVGFALWSQSANSIFPFFLKNLSDLNQKGRFELTFKCPKIEADTKLLVYTNRYFDGTKVDYDIVKFDNLNVTIGNVVNKSWLQPIEDIDAKIDSKADLALTQAQLLALEERTSLARENAIAEAMQNTISEVEARYKLWYETTTKDEKQKVVSDIASLFDRTVELNQKLGEASAKFEFINNETLIGEEGIAIGDKEGKAKLFMSQDSISFVTNGTAQMTLTGDTLMIKNGLFTERIQIGKYVEEVYDANPNFNVIRYIG